MAVPCCYANICKCESLASLMKNFLLLKSNRKSRSRVNSNHKKGIMDFLASRIERHMNCAIRKKFECKYRDAFVKKWCCSDLFFILKSILLLLLFVMHGEFVNRYFHTIANNTSNDTRTKKMGVKIQ